MAAGIRRRRIGDGFVYVRPTGAPLHDGRALPRFRRAVARAGSVPARAAIAQTEKEPKVE